MITDCPCKVPLYGIKFDVIIVDTFEEAKSYCPDINPMSAGVTIFNSDYTKLQILLYYNEFGEAFMVHAVHECEHLKNIIWNIIGYTISIDNDEPDAYLIENLFNLIMEAREKHKRHKEELYDKDLLV